jgi:hypothetical protein
VRELGASHWLVRHHVLDIAFLDKLGERAIPDLSRKGGSPSRWAWRLRKRVRG